MDWLTLISIIASALGGGLLAYLINPRAAWKKPVLENKNQEAQTKQIERQSSTEAYNAMQETIVSQENRNRELFSENVSCHKDLLSAQTDLIQCTTALCRWGMCPMREPEKGLGDEVLNECKKESKSLFDNTEFEVFAKQKGYKVEKIKEE